MWDIWQPNTFRLAKGVSKKKETLVSVQLTRVETQSVVEALVM